MNLLEGCVVESFEDKSFLVRLLSSRSIFHDAVGKEWCYWFWKKPPSFP